MKYPTQFMQSVPDVKLRHSRVVREVVWEEMKKLAEFRRYKDVPAVITEVYEIASDFKKLGYDITRILQLYENLKPGVKSNTKKGVNLTPDMVPWETIPDEIVQRCFNDDLELVVTQELKDYLGYGSSHQFQRAETVFDKYKYDSSIRDPKRDSDLIVAPIYDDKNKRKGTQYLIWDSTACGYIKAKVDLRYSFTTKTYEEFEWVVNMFSTPNSSKDSIGIPRSLLLKVLFGLRDFSMEYRRKYFENDYIAKLTKKSPEELRTERYEEEREYAVSAGGRYAEDTKNLWELVKNT